MRKNKILLIEGNARQVLPMAKSLRQLGHEVTTYNSSKYDYGYASRYPNRKLIRYIDHSDEKGTYDEVLREVSSYGYDVVIPMNDDMAILLSKHKKELEQYTKVAVNDWGVFKKAMDKLSTMQICMANGIPCPVTLQSKEEFDKVHSNLRYPLVIKPRIGCGAVGFHISADREDAERYIKDAERKFGPCLIQEYIPQTDLQYKAELFIDRAGELKSAVVFAKVRWYPVNGGSSTLNKTVDRKDIIEDCYKLLKTIGWRGYADIDLIQDPRDGRAKVIEINPRITGSVKICFKAGVNFAWQIVEDMQEEPVTPMMEYEEDVYLRYFQKDVLWLLKSPDRFSSSPNWFNFRQNTDQIFDWSDPWPFIVSSFESIPKLIRDSRKRKL